MKICATILALLVSCTLLIGQGGFNYQAIVRDANGQVISNQTVGIKISIRHGTADGPVVYQEVFTPFSNQYGLINLEIGTGEVYSGSFSTIDWGNGPYYMETAMDIAGGNNFVMMGSTLLKSVPYAMYASEAENVVEKKFNLGDRVFGGIVFYLNEDGSHGLVAANGDQVSGVDWWDATNNLNNPAHHDKAGAMFFDWRLPTKYELGLMYERHSLIGNFTRNWYWSATETGDGMNAWVQEFENGVQKTQEKSAKGVVRLVRVF